MAATAKCMRFKFRMFVQIKAGSRCKVSKSAFLLGLLRGKKWEADALFSSAEEANLPQECRQLLDVYRRSAHRSTSVR